MLRVTFFKLLVLMMILMLAIGCSGGGSRGTSDYEISGKAQKGPFLQGSRITIYELDNDFNQTGRTFETEIINDLGAYSLPVNLQSRYIELYVDGFFFNEFKGAVYSVDLPLSAVADVTKGSSFNINILTSLAKPRTIQLALGGLSFEDAEKQADEEVLSTLGFNYEDMGSFTHMDLLEEGDNNALLLAATSVVMQMAVNHPTLYTEDMVPALIDIITTIKNDIKDDGELDDSDIMDLIQTAVQTVDFFSIRDNLEQHYRNIDSDIVIPDFESFIYENSMFPSSEFAGNYQLLLEFGIYQLDITLTIYNQFYMTASERTCPKCFPIDVLEGQINESGEFTLTLEVLVDLVPIIIEAEGSIDENRTVTGTASATVYGDLYTGTITSL